MANESINTIPSANASFITTLQNFLNEEMADRDLERGFADTVLSGGLHGTSATMTSAAFATIGYVKSGHRVVQAAAAINYATMGAAASDTAWVIFSSSSLDNLDNFVRVTGTDYFVDCVSSTQPSLPANSGWLMKVTISGSAITAVTDLRRPASYSHAGDYDVSDVLYGAVGDGVTDNSAAITAAASAAIGQSTITAIHFRRPGTYVIGGNLTVSVPVYVHKGAIIKVSNPAHVVHFAAGFDAGPYQVFDADESTTGAVRFFRPEKLLAVWWGLDGVPENDVTTKFQAAVNALQPVDLGSFIRACLIVGPGFHRITSTINMTTGAGIGAHTGTDFNHQNTCIKGESRFLHTRFLGETGSDPVFDFTGSFYVHLENISIGTDRGIDSAAIGILMAAGLTTDGAHLTYMNNIQIDLEDDSTANGGIGTIGLVVFGAENGTYDTVQTVANLPLVVTSILNIGDSFGTSAFSISSQFVAVDTSHSVGVNTFTALTAQCIHERNSAIALYGTNSTSFHNVYMGRVDGNTGTYRTAVRTGGDVDGLTLSGTFEDFGKFMEIRGNLANAHLRMTASISNVDPWFDLGGPGGSGRAIFGVDFWGTNKVGPPVDVGFRTDDPSPREPLPISITNSRFYFASVAPLALSGAVPPLSVIRTTSGSRFATSSAWLEIDLNRQKLFVPYVEFGDSVANNVQAGFARILLPVPVTNLNGLVMHVYVRGNLIQGGASSAGVGGIAALGVLTLVRDATDNQTTSVISETDYTNHDVDLTGFTNFDWIFPGTGSPATHYTLGLEVDVQDAVAWGFTGEVEIWYNTPYAEAPLLIPNTNP